MKTTLLFLVALSIRTASAQPVLNNFYPTAPGTITSTRASCDTTGVVPGSGGANQSWVFNLAYAGPPITEQNNYLAAPGTLYADSFPSANLILTSVIDSSNSTYNYYLSTPSLYRELGYAQLNNGVATVTAYDDPKDVVFPMMFTGSQSDLFSASDTTFLTGYTKIIGTRGNASWAYDGYGTLSVNGVAYPNAVRLHGMEFDTLSYTYLFPGTDTMDYVYRFRIDEYIWLDPSTSQMLLGIFDNQFASDSGVLEDDKYVSVAVSPTAVADDNEDSTPRVSLLSNPASDEAVLSISGDASAQTRVTLVDVLGRPVSTSTLNKTDSEEHRLTISTRQLIPGLYFVHVETAEGWTATKKLLVK